MKRISVLVALALAQPALAADLSQIYQEAQARDATYATAEAAYRAGLERLPQGRAGLLPFVNLSGNVARIYSDVDGVPSTQYTGRGYTLSLAQPLFRTQNWATYDQAKQQMLQAEAQLSAAAQDLALRVSQAYFDVLLAMDNVAVSRSQKTAISEQLAQAKRNFEVGTATVTDANEAQARLDLAVRDAAQ